MVRAQLTRPAATGQYLVQSFDLGVVALHVQLIQEVELNAVARREVVRDVLRPRAAFAGGVLLGHEGGSHGCTRLD